MTAKLYNRNRIGVPEGAVDIGRGSRHGNVFVIGRDGGRSSVLHLHKMEIARRPEYLISLDELTGRDLVCYCVPESCHGDILLKLAAMSVEERLGWAHQYLMENGG